MNKAFEFVTDCPPPFSDSANPIPIDHPVFPLWDWCLKNPGVWAKVTNYRSVNWVSTFQKMGLQAEAGKDGYLYVKNSIDVAKSVMP